MGVPLGIVIAEAVAQLEPIVQREIVALVQALRHHKPTAATAAIQAAHASLSSGSLDADEPTTGP